ncbi:MAG: hypothetical protein M3N57_10735 [Actinomycetota bacterium]|nr:hypothetical protein [Actinomycetota bacterium]
MNARRPLILAATLALGLTACPGDEAPSPGGTPATPAEGEREFTITATDYAFDLPTTLRGGVVTATLQNDGEQPHEAVFVRVEPGTSEDQLLDAFDQAVEGGPIPDSITALSGIGVVPPGESVTSTFSLPEGEYVVLCPLTDEEPSDTPPGDEGLLTEAPAETGQETSPPATPTEEAPAAGPSPGQPAEGEEPEPHYRLGMATSVEVSDGDVADLPDADGTVVGTDYAFEVPELTAGSHTLVFRNDGEENHHAVLLEFAEGVDEETVAQTFEAFGQAGEGPPPEGVEEPEFLGASSVFSPGLGGTFEVEVTSGRTYAFACFIQDREGGPPHAFAYDMYQAFTVE